MKFASLYKLPYLTWKTSKMGSFIKQNISFVQCDQNSRLSRKRAGRWSVACCTNVQSAGLLVVTVYVENRSAGEWGHKRHPKGYRIQEQRGEYPKGQGRATAEGTSWWGNAQNAFRLHLSNKYPRGSTYFCHQTSTGIQPCEKIREDDRRSDSSAHAQTQLCYTLGAVGNGLAAFTALARPL